MGIGDFINSLTEKVKSFTPNLTLDYNYSSNTFSKVSNAVRSNAGPKLTVLLTEVKNSAKIGEKLSKYLPDDEGRAKIGRFAWIFGKNAVVLSLHEGVKLVPGGSFIRQTVLRSLPDEKKDSLTKEMKTLQTRITELEKQPPSPENPTNQERFLVPTNQQIVKRNFHDEDLLGERLISKSLENLMVAGLEKNKLEIG